MKGMLSLEKLKQLVKQGRMDTVLVCMTDMQGRLVGKRFSAGFFLDTVEEGTHACNYLLTVDIEMEPVPGYAAANWSAGYGDFALKPDLATLRRVPWLKKTAMVLCDVLDEHTHEPVAHSPRAILKKQIGRLRELGFSPMMASELEFYLFEDSLKKAHRKAYRGLKPAGYYIEDYHILQTTKEEKVIRAIRNQLQRAGIPVENSKGEWGPGQEEVNVRYAPALVMADRHAVMKNAIKEIAWKAGQSVTFMAKWNTDLAGSSCHVHQSLWDAGETRNLFYDPDGEYGMSDVMKHYVAGLAAHARELTYFLAPFVNSYKRFQASTFAPTRICWSVDNRTAGLRLVGENSKAIRIENRIGGADLNPYLAFAAQLAAGIDGIEKKMELDAPFAGDAYAEGSLREIPRTLREAIDTLDNSAMLREAFGDDVVEHYLHTARWEQAVFDRRVTDLELMRGFEQA